MDTKNFITLSIGLAIGVMLISGAMAPVISDALYETVENEGASWIRMAYVSDGSDYSAEYSFSGDTVTTGGQSGDGDTILYADSLCVLVFSDGDAVAICPDRYILLDGDVTVDRTDGTVTITDANDTYEIGVPEYAYVPAPQGDYAYFDSSATPLWQSRLVTVGHYAGVYCYNDYVTPSIGLVMDAEITDQMVDSVKWTLGESEDAGETEVASVLGSPLFYTAPVVDEDSDSSTAQDDDSETPSESGGGGLRAVPTPTYTDGDWGYNLVTVSGVQKAKIVSYSGAGGGAITIPATVGGYDVHSVGSGNYGETVFDTSLTSTSLTISNGIVTINTAAFDGCTGLTGTLTLPNTLISVATNAFRGCSGLNGTLTIPSSVYLVSTASFKDCAGFSALVLNEGLTTIEIDAFMGCTHISGQLVLPSTLTTLESGAFNGCSGITGDITIPNGITTLNTVFRGCTGITGVHLGNVTRIGTEAFNGCTGLTGTLEIPSNVQQIERGAFAGCTGLTGLILNEGLISLTNTSPSAQGAFYGCTGLTGTLVIPSTVTTIGYRTFVSTNFTNLIVLCDAIPATATGVYNPGNFSNTPISQVLNLSNNEWTTTSYGLNAEEVRTDIPAMGFVADTLSHSEPRFDSGTLAVLLGIVPLLVTAGLIVIGTTFIRKE